MAKAYAKLYRDFLSRTDLLPASKLVYACICNTSRDGLTTVQKLCGHANVQTTVRHYTWVSDEDKRDGIAKLQRGAAG